MNDIIPKSKHIPVMLSSVIDSLPIKDNMTVVDATLGGGGHTLETIKKADLDNLKLQVIGIDQDRAAIDMFISLLLSKGYQYKSGKYILGGIQVRLIHSNFDNLTKVLNELYIPAVDAIIADLGFSTDQLEEGSRGFSFMKQGSLDMRMDPSSDHIKAADLLNVLDRKQLINLFQEYGDLTWEAPKIVKGILEYRKSKIIENTSELVSILKTRVSHRYSRHVEARAFQAIRIVVNHELDALESFLPQSLNALAPQGVMSILTFHSGEDRIVKHFFKHNIDKGSNNLIKPSDDEIGKNPKSSSVKLRTFVKYGNN